MARSKEFEVDAALDAAIGVFWQHGFAGTSTDMLTKAMKIGRQSLYDTFGDKRALFLAALRNYATHSTSELIALIEAAPSPRAGLRAGLLHSAKSAASDGRGCFGINTHCELGTTDPEVTAILDTAGGMLHNALVRAIQSGKQRGELRSDLDAKTAARFYATQLSGLRVAARAGADARTLTTVAELALTCFD